MPEHNYTKIAGALTERVAKTTLGFTDIARAADEVMSDPAIADKHALGHALLESDVHQARMLAVFLFGYHAAANPRILSYLKNTVSRDPAWQVQEILAQAFDRYCKDTGYEAALPAIRDWLADPHPNVRRAVTEGLRIWTARPYFKEHPAEAISLLAAHHADDSEYLRKSVGNALRDISRAHPDLVRAEVETWNITDKRVKLTHKLASKFLTPID
jgi:3-methyladenine DNA glycosylase AlkC